MKRLFRNNHADVSVIGAAVAILAALMISIVVVYNVASSIDVSTTTERSVNAARGYVNDQYNNSTPILNSTDATLAQAATFYTLAPLVVVVIIAITILGYVMTIGRRQ